MPWNSPVLGPWQPVPFCAAGEWPMKVCGLVQVVYCCFCVAEPTLGLWAKRRYEQKLGGCLVPGGVLHFGRFWKSFSQIQAFA